MGRKIRKNDKGRIPSLFSSLLLLLCLLHLFGYMFRLFSGQEASFRHGSLRSHLHDCRDDHHLEAITSASTAEFAFSWSSQSLKCDLEFVVCCGRRLGRLIKID